MQIQKQKAITLIALVITVIVLLILAGVTISTLGGNDGLIAKVEKAKTEQMKAEAKENINMAIIQIQTQEVPKGTEVTLQILNDNLNAVDNRIQPKDYTAGDRELKGIYTADKDTKFNFKIDGKLNVIIGEIAEEEKTFPITVTDIEKTSLRVTGDADELNAIGATKFTYVALTSTSSEIKYENITATSYTVTGLEPGTEYDVYMLAYDNAGNVTKSSVETVTTKDPEIQITDPYIGTSITETDSSKSVADNSQLPRITTLYINFKATLEGKNCIVTLKDDKSQTVPYTIIENGTYTFIATGTYNGKTITKEIEVVVNKYKLATGLVKYDAGTWTQEEIDKLTKEKLYDYNESRSTNEFYKLNNDDGLALTFGGFKVGDSRNNSVMLLQDKEIFGEPMYDGWQILESYEKNGRIYVTKIVHAGSPENFVHYNLKNIGNYAEYILSNGLRKTSYNQLSDGTTINPRSWQMYIDNNQIDLIEDTTDKDGNIVKDIHIMTYDEAFAITGSCKNTTSLRKTGGWYWLANAGELWDIYVVKENGRIASDHMAAIGIRPVVSLKSGVYIVSGDGTKENPYVLGKD